MYMDCHVGTVKTKKKNKKQETDVVAKGAGSALAACVLSNDHGIMDCEVLLCPVEGQDRKQPVNKDPGKAFKVT